MTTAGTAAHRCGRLVTRVDRTANRAQPNPNPRSIEPVMTASVAPGKTTRARTRAVRAPAAREPATTPVTGRVRGGDAVPPSRVVVGRMSTLMTVSLSQ